jgi:hypothetical protein
MSDLKLVNFRCEEDLIARLDKARGEISKSQYVRGAIEQRIAREEAAQTAPKRRLRHEQG